MNQARRATRITILLWLMCVLLQGVAWSKPRPMAAVIAGGGTLQVQRAGAKDVALLALRVPLFAGDVVITGANGSAKVLFDDGSQVKMRANSKLEITAPATPQKGTSLFRALAGEIWARLRPGRSAHTVYTNLVVRGTEFNLVVAPDDTATLTVIEGAVEFSNQFGAVTVGESQQSVARPGAAPTQPVTIPNARFIIEWTLDIENAALPVDRFFAVRNPAVARRQAAQILANPNAAPTLESADWLYDAGEFAAALARYQALGNMPEARLRAGYALLELGRLDDAATAFRTLATGAPLVQFVAVADETIDNSPIATRAWTGLAWTELKRNRLAAAQDAGKQAIAALQGAPVPVETHLVLGIAHLRQNQSEAAETQLKAALQANPAAQQYQARAWLALLLLSRSQNEEALSAARLAVKEAPDSALAQASLANVAFFAGETSEATRAAKRAAALDPDDVAAQIALGQAQLAQGDVDAAARTAARATALDPKMPQAHYLLGIADAGRRDYRHAETSLQNALQIAPEFFPATAALARVYVRMGREAQAQALLADYEKRHGESDMIYAARGEVLFAAARYDESIAAYKRGLALRPSSAFGWNGLARVALEANRLTEAINAGERAVSLAPNISAYHSTLGLAYQFGRLNAQAARSFRTALVLDPSNAVALVQLGRLQKEGDPRTTERNAALTFAQGFIFEPDVAREIMRGGIKTETELRGGNHNRAEALVNRDTVAEGRLHSFLEAFNGEDGGNLPNSDLEVTTVQQNTTYQASPRTTVFGHYLYRRNEGGLAGTLTNPVADDRINLRNHEGIFAARHRLSGRAHLWGGLSALSQRERRTNPDTDFSMIFASEGGFGLTLPARQATNRSSILNPEIRLDFALSEDTNRRSLLTLGYARPRLDNLIATNVFSPSLDVGIPPLTGTALLQQKGPTDMLYAQWDGRVNERLTLSGQLRHQRQKHTILSSGKLVQDPIVFDLTAPPVTTVSTHVLPSFVANYRAGRRTNVRFFANRRMTDIASSIFAPPGTLLTTEEQVLPNGLPTPGSGDLRSYEINVERYVGQGGLWKLFAFHTSGRNLIYDFSGFANPTLGLEFGNVISNSLDLSEIKRIGIGTRFEQQLAPGLFGLAALTFNRTTASANFFNPLTGTVDPAPFNGKIAPYHPRVVANVGLNYVAPSGIKAGVDINYTGSVFADLADPNATLRPRLGSSTLVDLTLAKESLVHQELFIKVLNVFDKQRFIFNDIPLQRRRIVVGVTGRF